MKRESGDLELTAQPRTSDKQNKVKDLNVLLVMLSGEEGQGSATCNSVF